jgi:hypothetical protein
VSKKSILQNPTLPLFLILFPSLLFSAPAGIPGSSDRALAVRGGMGLGFSILDLKGEERDQLWRLELAMPKVSVFPTDFVEISGTLLGLAYTRREATDFRGLFGFGGEGTLRLYPLVQNENAGISFAFEAGYAHRENEGIRKEKGESKDDLLLQRTAHLGIFLSYRGDIWGAYGGVQGRRSWVYQRTEGNTTLNLVPIGAFFGLDFYVNPLIFFSLEFHTFEQDALYFGVGANLTP